VGPVAAALVGVAAGAGLLLLAAPLVSGRPRPS
jgi:hypothetical protein